MLFEELKTGAVASIELCGWKHDDGYVLGTNRKGDVVTELPQRIHANGNSFGLEKVEVGKNGFFNALYC